MRFILEQGFTVKVGMEEAYQQWMLENEPKLAAAHPEGMRYLGTFVVVFASEKESGFYRTLVELDSYGAMDRSAAAFKDPDSEFGKLLREASKFGDFDLRAPWSNSLYKAVVDATIVDPLT
jgi:hypothetical protein